MSLIIDLDPAMGISAETFTTAWNNHTTASQLATASADDSIPVTFNDPLTIAVLTAVGTGLVTLGFDVLKEQINAVLKELREKDPKVETLSIPPNAKIERIRNHDGSEIITVTIPKKVASA